MSIRARAVVSVAVAILALLAVTPLAMAQKAADEDQKDQVFEAIMFSVDSRYPNASGIAKIILPSPRFWPLNRFMYVRVEVEGLPPNIVDNFIHIHNVRVDAQGVTNLGCFAGGPVVINLNALRTDANGKAVSVTRVVLNEDGSIFQDAAGRSNALQVNRASLTRGYVQYHIPAGFEGAGSPAACGEITLAGFDRGAPFR